MKRILLPILLLTLFSAACQSTESKTESPSQGPTSKPTEVSPVYVSALCTLMGMESRSEVPGNRPVIVMWGWSAATVEQIQDYIQAGVVVVTFDSKELNGEQQGGIPFDETAKVYKAVWMAGAGIPVKGPHTIAYSLTFRRKIFDGTDYYGPGTKNEKLDDRCEVEVK